MASGGQAVIQPTEEQLGEFALHVQQLAQEHGVQVTPDDAQRLLADSISEGFTPDATERLFLSGFEIEYPDDVESYEELSFDNDEDDEPIEPYDQQVVRKEMADLKSEDMALAAREAGKAIGRPLTRAEVDRVGELLPAQTPLGERVRPAHMIAAMQQAGVKSWGDMSREEINEVVTQRARELDTDPPHRDEYDVYNDNRQKSHDEWTAYMVDRVEGRVQDGEFTDVEEE
jgi:hypothetical protein